VTRRDFPGVAIAFDKLAALLAGPTELVRTYYDALPYLPYNPSEQDRHRYVQRRRFYKPSATTRASKLRALRREVRRC
jgi:hypothetical protein